MLSAISSRLGYPTTTPSITISTESSITTTEEDSNLNEPPPFPLLNSIQRAKSSSSTPNPPTPSFSFDSPPVSDNEDEEEDEYENENIKIEKEALSAPTKTDKLAKRVKVFVEPGYSQLHWAKLKSSGADLRGGIKQLQRITPTMLAQHISKDDCWQAYHGKVYNVTPFMKYHPGGVPELMRAAGRDGTELFMKTHAWVNAEFMMGECTLVGFLCRED